MEPTWMVKGRLCCFAEDTVRIEIGPQYVELEVNAENLSDKVTHPAYKLGAIDALGRLIGTEKTMTVVDRESKFVPHLWKVYELQKSPALDRDGNEFKDEDGETVMIDRFIKIDEKEDFDEALAIAETLVAA